MKSETGGVVGSSTYFTYEQHVDDQNSHRHDHVEREIQDVVYNVCNIATMHMVLVREGACDRQRDQCQDDNDFLCSGS